MRIDKQIASLRDDPAAQRLAQHKFDRGKAHWLSTPNISSLLEDMELYSDRQPLEELHHLNDCVTNHTSAKRLIDNWQSCFA